MRANVYIDGFNLYYGALKNEPAIKWLDVKAMCELYFPIFSIQEIKYFTARIQPKPSDPSQLQRQGFYFRALSTVSNLSIHYGHFLTSTVNRPLSDGSGMVSVIKSEEKGSDVNLACHLLNDAYLNRYDVAVVVSNDSDLLCPIRMVKEHLGKKIALLNPHKKPSNVLVKNADFIKRIRKGALATCQFPDELSDNNGVFRRPKEWR